MDMAPPARAGGSAEGAASLPPSTASRDEPNPGSDPAWAGLTLDRPRMMGVLNVTPDSFSDGGAYGDPDAAARAGLAMAEAGADIIDIGGESTRPGAQPVPPEIEQARVIPVIRALAARGLRISIDTRNAATMMAALDAGATLVNDVSALTHDPAATQLVRTRRCPVVLMHMRGTPATMNTEAHYTDVVREVAAELAARIASARAAGIRREQIAIDPGIGFAKLARHSLTLLQQMPDLAKLGYPLVVGVSRKRFLGRIGGEEDPRRRLPASIAAGLFAVAQGAHILRVHDVPETAQALRVWAELRKEAGASLAARGASALCT
jgi:dihydropteroate synthase